MEDMHAEFDLVVIGSGPAGQSGALAAADMGKSVAVVDRREMIGGVSLHTGTIPSKTLREAILYLSGFRQRAFYGRDYALKEDISVSDLKSRVALVMEREMEVVRAQLKKKRVTVIYGSARFKDPHSLEVDTAGGPRIVRGGNILIACGSRTAHDPHIPYDGRRIFNPDHLQLVRTLPDEVIVVGAGVIGIEYASMFTAINIHVTIIDERSAILDFADTETVEALMYHMRQRGALFHLGEHVVSVDKTHTDRVAAVLESGKIVEGDALLYSVGRNGNADLLRPEAAGLAANERGRLRVDDQYRTPVPHIYAAGDVIGFPALAATSMEQGRCAVAHMFGLPVRSRSLLPFGIYTIPEISMVGKTERQLTAEKVRYEVGMARYSDLAKGQMLGDTSGTLKLLFDPESLQLLGIHVIGEQAAEIIHVGQAVMALNGTLEYFRDSVFNYPTFAEAYKVASLDGFARAAAARRNS